jgi:hypothetical protein
MPTTPPECVAALLDGVQALGGGDLREHLQHLSAQERADWVVSLHRLLEVVEVAAIEATDVLDQHGDGELLHGASSTSVWLRGACRLSAATAHQRVRVARLSRSALAAPLAAVAAGECGVEHLKAIERGTHSVPPSQRDQAVTVLTELARTASVEDVRVASRRLREVVDPDGAALDLDRQFERRHLTISPLLDGMSSIDGVLDAEGAALLSTALEPFLTPTGPEDTRTAAQRRADGLLQIVQSAADTAALPLSGGERPQLRLVVDRHGPAAVGGDWLPDRSIGRLVCDAAVSRLLLDEHGVVVNLGRERRLFSSAQRKVLAVRDGGCRWPGCTRPPAHTDAHHVRPWIEGGATDLDNAVLLCRFHHRLVHEGGWRIEPVRLDRGTHGPVMFSGPLGQSLTSRPRGP